jgi:hypothetical protein
MTSEAEMIKIPILEEVRAITESFPSVRPRERTKLTGALTVEILRERLREGRIPISVRDVFVRGNPTEFDLLIVRPSASPLYSIVYDPVDVAAVLEIKFSGVYSPNAVVDLKRCFQRIKKTHPHIECIYLTVCEAPNFKNRITADRLGFPVFTLYWWKDYKRMEVKQGDSLQSIIDFLRNALRQLPNHI